MLNARTETQPSTICLQNRHVDFDLGISICESTCRFAKRRFDSDFDMSILRNDASIRLWTRRLAKRRFDSDFDASIRESTLRCLNRRLRSPRPKKYFLCPNVFGPTGLHLSRFSRSGFKLAGFSNSGDLHSMARNGESENSYIIQTKGGERQCRL